MAVRLPGGLGFRRLGSRFLCHCKMLGSQCHLAADGDKGNDRKWERGLREQGEVGRSILFGLQGCSAYPASCFCSNLHVLPPHLRS